MGLVVVTGLAVFFAAILLSFLVMMVLKCRRTKKSSVVDEEGKEDAQGKCLFIHAKSKSAFDLHSANRIYFFSSSSVHQHQQ